MKLDDTAIAQIAKLIQVAIITGTDIVDQLRTMEFVPEEDLLKVDPSYLDNFNKNLEKMISEMNQNQEPTTFEDAEQLKLF